MIISASRRTDIPAFYSEWLLNRLKEGFVYTRNPMNHSQVSKITLSPDIVDCIVFWSKDPKNIMDKLTTITNLGYQFYFQFTLNPYDKKIEPYLRNKKALIETFIELSEKIGTDKVIWRYDPIILNQELTDLYHYEQFESMCSKLKGYTNACVISFVDIYSKLSKIVKTQTIREVSQDEIENMALKFKSISTRYGIELRTCCESSNLLRYGIGSARCIDKELIEKICKSPLAAKKEKNQRDGCECIQSIDIGAYNTCLHGCVYYYANYSYPTVVNNTKRHNPKGDILIDQVMPKEKVVLREMESLKVH